MTVQTPYLFEVIAPHIHDNGTSPETLSKRLTEVYEKLDEAYSTLKEAAPNGRDYYNHPAGVKAMQLATAQHQDRLRVISTLMDHLEEELQKISQQVP